MHTPHRTSWWKANLGLRPWALCNNTLPSHSILAPSSPSSSPASTSIFVASTVFSHLWASNIHVSFAAPMIWTAAAAAGCAQLLKAHRTDNPTTRPPRQTIAIRTSGFNSVDLTKLSSSILWLYTGMTMTRDPYTRHTRHTHTRATHTVSSPYQTSIRNDVHRRIARCHHCALHRQDQR